MATINAPTLNDTQYSGDCPLALAHGVVTLASAAIADKVRFVKLYAGTKIHDARIVTAAIGASATVSVGWEYVDGTAGGSSTALIAATGQSTNGRMATVTPITLAKDAYITGTVAGATATGQVDVQVMFEFKGK